MIEAIKAPLRKIYYSMPASGVLMLHHAVSSSDFVIRCGLDTDRFEYLVNEYRGNVNIYHFDMYRVQSWDDLYSTGFFDYIDNGVLVIEWSENIEGALPEEVLRITISRGDHDNQRIFEIEGVDSL